MYVLNNFICFEKNLVEAAERIINRVKVMENDRFARLFDAIVKKTQHPIYISTFIISVKIRLNFRFEEKLK